MNILKNLSKLFLLFSFSLLCYVVILLLFNSTHGFDITDESYYILTATYPHHIFSTVSHEGYYTGLLYALAGYNLAYFRVFGIVVLIFIALWFSIEQYKYIIQKFHLKTTAMDKYFFIIPITIGALSYYKVWLLTPSYNWLALIGTMLVFTMLFRVINNKVLNDNKYITLDYFLLSFSFCLAFMAKPSTALVLVCLSVLFIIYEFKNLHLKKALGTVTLVTSVMVMLHISILDGGCISYYDRLIESMKRMALLGGGHTLDNRYYEMIELFKEYFFEHFYFHQINNFYMYGFIGVVTILFLFRKKINALNIYLVWMFIILVLYAYIIFTDSVLQNFNLLWIRSIEWLYLNFLLILISILFMDKQKAFLLQILKILPLFIIIILGSLAYKFGSNNQIIYAMSDSMIFVFAVVVILNFIFDQKVNIRGFTMLSGVLLSSFIYFTLNYAYDHPYRLITNIKNQNQNVALLGGLNVDNTTKIYIENLQNIAKKNKISEEDISLIDMTGGSPGVNVILDANIFSTPWLIGAYKGSNKMVERILKAYQGTNRLKKAWILVAPKGKRKLDLTILKHIGLAFPDDYIKIGTVQTAHRYEVQEVWKPI